MQSFCLAGKDYILDGKGVVMASVPHLRIPGIDPQIALQRARLVFERTLADPSPQFGGYAMAKFTTEQHLRGHYTGRNRHQRISHIALQRIWTAVAAW